MLAHRFTFGGKNLVKHQKSQNIMKTIVDLFEYAKFNGDVHFFRF